MANTREIYEKYCNGDVLSGEQVLEGMQLFEAAHSALIRLGPAFEVTRKECNNMWIRLEGIAFARGILK